MEAMQAEGRPGVATGTAMQSEDGPGMGAAVQQLARRKSRLPRRRFAIAGLVMVVAIAYLIISSFSAAVASVVSPAQLIHHRALYGQSLRLQGRVAGADHVDKATLDHLFTVSDGHASVLVSYGSDLPGGFKSGASVEAQGTYNGHIFVATAGTLTAKCPTKYQAAPASN